MAPCRKTSTLTFNLLLAGNLPELSRPNQTVYERLRYSHWECVQMVPQVMRCCRSGTNCTSQRKLRCEEQCIHEINVFRGINTCRRASDSWPVFTKPGCTPCANAVSQQTVGNIYSPYQVT